MQPLSLSLSLSLSVSSSLSRECCRIINQSSPPPPDEMQEAKFGTGSTHLLQAKVVPDGTYPCALSGAGGRGRFAILRSAVSDSRKNIPFPLSHSNMDNSQLGSKIRGLYTRTIYYLSSFPQEQQSSHE